MLTWLVQIIDVEKEKFNQLVQKLKKSFEDNKDSDEYKWIEEQTKYGLKQNFLKQITQCYSHRNPHVLYQFHYL